MATSHVPFAFRMPPRGDRKGEGGRLRRRSARETKQARRAGPGDVGKLVTDARLREIRRFFTLKT